METLLFNLKKNGGRKKEKKRGRGGVPVVGKSRGSVIKRDGGYKKTYDGTPEGKLEARWEEGSKEEMKFAQVSIAKE